MDKKYEAISPTAMSDSARDAAVVGGCEPNHAVFNATGLVDGRRLGCELRYVDREECQPIFFQLAVLNAALAGWIADATRDLPARTDKIQANAKGALIGLVHFRDPASTDLESRPNAPEQADRG